MSRLIRFTKRGIDVRAAFNWNKQNVCLYFFCVARAPFAISMIRIFVKDGIHHGTVEREYSTIPRAGSIVVPGACSLGPIALHLKKSFDGMAMDWNTKS